ncbi:MAG: transglycosylase SLT domain-containing protein [Gemmatimonadota bacterium]|nr:transglycosylase SLT domain-containing protein [Gemmatimonadota bacterium]
MRIEEPDPHGRAGWTRRLVGRGAAVLLVALIVSALAGSGTGVRADEEDSPALTVVAAEVRAISRRLEALRGELTVARAQARRAEAILRYSGQYQIPGDLAAAIYDIAVSEGIETDVAFRLVKVESNFRPDATSHRGAIGYTQILQGTAQFYERGLSVDQLRERDVNLRIGFRFLRDLMRRYDGDIELALLAYNRGPGRVEEILLQGGDPANGYARKVLEGTRHEK